MKKIVFILLFQHCFSSSFSQSIKKYDIGQSGAAAYFFCDPGPFTMLYSEDSSKVYSAECNNEETTYGVIYVKLPQPLSGIAAGEELLVTYLDYLKKSFKIVSFAGYGKGHRLKGREDTRGVIDYWKDENKNNWKIKGWTDGRSIAVLYAFTKNDLPETKVNVFLDSISFE